MSSSPSSVPSVDRRAPLTVWLFFAFSWLLGGWLAFDGLHQRLFGDYVRIDGQLGPWAVLVRAVGVDPLSLGWFFIVLGLALIAASFGLYLRRRWGYYVGLGASALGLLYLGFGTPVALICLALLLLKPTRNYVWQVMAKRDE
ncbi:MAG: hypothetical protein ACRDH2_10530 [Anaerolineales bacterium]